MGSTIRTFKNQKIKREERKKVAIEDGGIDIEDRVKEIINIIPKNEESLITNMTILINKLNHIINQKSSFKESKFD